MRTSWCIVLLGSLLAAASGCDFKQDPLSGKPGPVKDGNPNPTKPDPAKPVPSDAIRITGPDFAFFEEGVQQEFTLIGRVLIEDYTATMVIENMSDFPGARYDAANQKFTWRPAPGFVTSVGEGVIVNRKLKIKVTATRADSPVLIGTREIPMQITRMFTAPEIIQVSRPRTTIREGEELYVSVVVNDRDADSRDRNSWPQLQISSFNNTKSLAGQLNILNVYHRGGTQYEFNLSLNLREAELTRGAEQFSAGLRAFSKYGKISSLQTLQMTILTSFGTAVSTWTSPIKLVAGTETRHTFLVSDIKQEAALSLQRFDGPMGSSLTCVRDAANPSLLMCTFVWTPADNQVGNFNLTPYIDFRNRNTTDSGNAIRTLTLPLAVDAKPVPTPDPTPTPTPTPDPTPNPVPPQQPSKGG